jgi:glutaconate CoA-transferase, subunit B
MNRGTKMDGLCSAEIMALVLSRYYHGEIVTGVGAYSTIPLASMHIARLVHNPDLWWFAGDSATINPKFEGLTDSASDVRNTWSPEHVARMQDLITYDFGLWRKKTTIAVLGGLQIDKYGNTNLVCVGNYRKPKVRGPGTVGLVFTAHFCETYYYVHHHNPKVFVEKVDFVSGPGFSPTRSQNIRSYCKGPSLVVTPISVMGFEVFEEPVKTMYLKSVHRGHTVDEVIERTGFKLNFPKEGVVETPAPTHEEIEALHRVDPKGVLKRLRVDD